MSDMSVCFVSGANRGIGFELAHQLVERGWHVIGGYRVPERSRELLREADDHETLHAFPVDVNNERQLRKLQNYISETFGRLDLLVNNAGINPGSGTPLDEASIDDLRNAYDVNVLGPFLTTRYLRQLLSASKAGKIVNIGSRAGSVESSSGNNVPYRLSKSALNMLTKAQAQEYEKDGTAVIVMTPGWVRTDMGGADATLSTGESVKGMLRVIEGLTMEQSGRFLSHDGEEVRY